MSAMSVIYLLSKDASARKDSGRVLLENAGEKVCSLPMENITHIVIGRQASVSMPLVFALLESGIPISWIKSDGTTLAFTGDARISLSRLLRQKEKMEDPEIQMRLTHQTLARKIQAQRGLLRQHAQTRSDPALNEAIHFLTFCLRNLTKSATPDEARGWEGQAAKSYFSCFPVMASKKWWQWKGRTRRPAADPVNALLNFGYAFLEREVRIAIAGARLDPRISFLHGKSRRKDSLVYDLMDPFRPSVIDRFVLRLLNRGSYGADDFEKKERACRLTEPARKAWYTFYEEYMETVLQSCQGQTPRQYIRNTIEELADTLCAPKPAPEGEEGEENGE